MIVVLIVAAKLVLIDLFHCRLSLYSESINGYSASMVYQGDYSLIAALMRGMDFAAVIAFLTFAWSGIRSTRTESDLAPKLFPVTALLLLFVYLTLELNTILYLYAPANLP